MNASPQAAISPVFRPFTKGGLQGVTFHVSQHGQKVSVFFHWKRLETPLIQMSRAFRVIMSMPSHRVRMGQPAKKISELCVCVRSDNEVPVVWHHRVREKRQRHAIASSRTRSKAA